MNHNESWRSLLAGRELDRIIAERLGQEIDIWKGMDDEGQRLQEFTEYYIVYNSLDNREHRQTLPYYSTNLSTAITLWTDDPEWSLMVSDLGGFQATYPCHNPIMDTPCEVAATPALAVCRAWLAWRAASDIEPTPNGGGGE